MPDTSVFQTIDATMLEDATLKMLCDTAQRAGRVEITGCAGRSCVIISKQELEGLERALEVLSRTREAREMQSRVRGLIRIDHAHGEYAATA